MNVPPTPNDPPWWQSKKLASLALGIIAILAVTVIAIIWVLDNAIVVGAYTSITSLVSIHVSGQAAVDRAQAYSPNYPNVPPPPAVRVP